MRKSNQQQFETHIFQWQQSGLSQKAWCSQNNVPYSTFHYWCRRLRNQPADSRSNKEAGFVPLVVQDLQTGGPWCELVSDNGQRLIFHHPVSAEFIRKLLA